MDTMAYTRNEIDEIDEFTRMAEREFIAQDELKESAQLLILTWLGAEDNGMVLDGHHIEEIREVRTGDHLSYRLCLLGRPKDGENGTELGARGDDGRVVVLVEVATALVTVISATATATTTLSEDARLMMMLAVTEQGVCLESERERRQREVE